MSARRGGRVRFEPPTAAFPSLEPQGIIMTAKWLLSLTPALSASPSASESTEKNEKTAKPARAPRVAQDSSRRARAQRDAKRVQSFVPRGRGR